MKQIKNQISLILTLKERPEYTKRWLNYHTRKFKGFPILIADGSYSKKNHKIISPFLKNPKCLYLNFGPDKNLLDYQKKLNKILKESKPRSCYYVIMTTF